MWSHLQLYSSGNPVQLQVQLSLTCSSAVLTSVVSGTSDTVRSVVMAAALKGFDTLTENKNMLLTGGVYQILFRAVAIYYSTPKILCLHALNLFIATSVSTSSTLT